MFSEEPGRTLTDTLADHLRRASGCSCLLDNCEQMLAAAADVAATLLTACAQVRTIATEPGDHGHPRRTTYQVPRCCRPVRADSAGADTIGRSDSVRLFVERAALVRAPGSSSMTQNAPIVAEICRRLDGIPLAIELAAARVKVLATDESSPLGWTTCSGCSPVGVGRPCLATRALRATISGATDLLSAPEQELLRNLSVFAGGWTLDAATAVSGSDQDEFEVLDALARLVDKSLVVVAVEGSNTRKSRYRLLETVRQYALEKLNEAGQGGAVRDRHLAYFALAQRHARLTGPEQVRWLSRLEAEHGRA